MEDHFITEVDAFTAPESGQEAQQASLQSLIALMKQGNPSALQLITSLGPALTSEDDRVRMRGVMLFAEVVATAPDLFRLPSDIATAAEFFSARLADRTCVRGALTGCLALIQRRAAGNAATPALDATAATVIVKRFQQHILVQAFGQVERMLSFDLILASIQGYGDELLTAGIDFLDILIVAAEGERDPRCLLRVFECVQHAVALYARARPQSLEEGAEGLFDALTWYFPMAFTPPPVNKYNITREMLVQALETTFTSTSLFAPHFIPLALDKLSSSVRQAKLDALSGLAAAAERFGTAAMQPHIDALWRGLRAELLAGASADAVSDAAGDDVADAAAACLQRCATALGSMGLTAEVLADACVDDLLACLAAADTEALPRTAARVQSVSRILAAVAGASDAASLAVCQRVMPGILAAAQSQDATTERLMLRVLALRAAHRIVQSVLQSTTQRGISATTLQAYALELLRGTAPVDAQSGGELAGFSPLATTRHSPPDLQQAQVALLASLGAFPSNSTPLPPEGVAEAAHLLLEHLQQDGEAGPADGSHSAASAALEGLSAMAGAGHSALLQQVAVPRLLSQLAAPPVGATLPRQHAATSLSALAALARASSELRPAVLTALRDAMAAALARQLNMDTLLQPLLHTVQSSILTQIPQPYSDADQGPVSDLINVVISIEDTVQLPVDALAACTALVASAAQRSMVSANQAAAATAGLKLLQLSSGNAAAAGSGLQDEHMNTDALAPPGLASQLLQWRAAVPAALLASVQPAVWEGTEVCSGPSIVDLCSALLRLHSAAYTAPQAARILTVTAASILNKAPAGDVLEARLEAVLDNTVLPALADAIKAKQAASLLGYLTRGLAMRGHARASECLQQLISLASRPDGGSPAADEAAAALETVISDVAPDQAVNLDKASHAIARPLWQQRTFTQASGLLLGALHEGLRSGTPAPLPLLAALARLAAAAPPKLLRPAVPRLLPWLLEALRRLQADGDTAATSSTAAHSESRKASLLAAATAVKTATQQPTAQAAVAEHGGRLLPLLAGLAAFQPSADVRRGALEALTPLASELPRHIRGAHKAAVLAAARAALDDRKRAVRAAAVRCRAAWTPA